MQKDGVENQAEEGCFFASNLNKFRAANKGAIWDFCAFARTLTLRLGLFKCILLHGSRCVFCIVESSTPHVFKLVLPILV